MPTKDPMTWIAEGRRAAERAARLAAPTMAGCQHAAHALAIAERTIRGPLPDDDRARLARTGMTVAIAEAAAGLYRTAEAAAVAGRLGFEAERARHAAAGWQAIAVALGDPAAPWPAIAPAPERPAPPPVVRTYHATCPAYPCDMRATFTPAGPVQVEITTYPQGLGEGGPSTRTETIARADWPAYERRKLAAGYRAD